MSGTRKRAAKPSNGWAHSADQWRKRVIQNVTLPSGQQVTIRIPGLGALARLDALPKELAEIALLEISREGGAAAALAKDIVAAAGGDDEAADSRVAEGIRRLGELTKRLVVESLIDPKLTYEELDDVPEDDLEKLMRIVSRRDPFDSAGRVIGALPVSDLAAFQETHGCPPDCGHCQEAARALQTSVV